MILHSISMVRNEADVIETFVRYHALFLDRMIIVDHGSTDGTGDILRALRKEGLPIELRIFEEFAQEQDAVLTELCWELQEKGNADWILPLDADEFLMSPGEEDVRAVLASLPEDRLVLLPWISHIPLAEDDAAKPTILLRMRHCRTPEETYPKVIAPRRALPAGGFLSQGNHRLYDANDSLLEHSRYAPTARLALAHYPVRSPGQLRRKVLDGWVRHIARTRAAASEAIQWRSLFLRCCDPRPLEQQELTNIALAYARREGTPTPSIILSPFTPPVLPLSQTPHARLNDEDPAALLLASTDSFGAYMRALQENPAFLSVSQKRLALNLRRAQGTIARMQRTRSWRWTLPLRLLQETLQRMVERW